ncbi:hypothetical protein GCM10010217_76190 [Streptomyces tubercidicus]
MWCKDNVNASDMNTVIHHIGKQSLNREPFSKNFDNMHKGS